MHVPISIYRQWLLLVIAYGLSVGGLADEGQAFRVCADPNILPFSAKA